ncbi:hypothetical protein [Streptomyces sp. NPDC005799]|uniref:hypothetical protein n=1 Tax=Streptomyces sp. NPDC005799 TaxID=3154678 RepID=UPI0033CF8D62
MSTTDPTNPPASPRHRLGEPDAECRYPVLIADDQCLGHIFRWHGAWFAIAAGGSSEVASETAASAATAHPSTWSTSSRRAVSRRCPRPSAP